MFWSFVKEEDEGGDSGGGGGGGLSIDSKVGSDVKVEVVGKGVVDTTIWPSCESVIRIYVLFIFWKDDKQKKKQGAIENWRWKKEKRDLPWMQLYLRKSYFVVVL